MRLVFQCTVCGVLYLPPEGLAWSDGRAASPLWCNRHHVAAAARGITENPAAVALALAAARLRTGVPQAEEQPPRPDVRPSRPARTRRVSRAATGRSKLK
ncbi:hypothetical protein C7C46_28260 [Streptomyces tateyamensis]|uniref:Uncharacterized protein n=1 Tax=Streptomyces tateyamensis TaxID=565073 RepID=A0A2V4N1R1_9ACTN|nr:hypothetical protein [Streptomyces tateyamensis]PYC69146.1 hypothetical protein C7C46_28260 [Streptomyces tateyamensis]